MNENIATIIAKDLLNIRAVQFQNKVPFTWPDGTIAPLYADNRVTMAYPRIRSAIADALADIISTEYPEATVICGVPTAGIPYATLVSERLNKPLIYVHANLTQNGQINELEGKLTTNDRVVLVDDLIASGNGALSAASAINQVGSTVLGVAAIFSYQLPEVKKVFSTQKVKLTTLTDYDHLIKEAKTFGMLSTEVADLLANWRK